MTLHHAASQLMVQDEFESERVHDVTVPFHFAPEVMIHDLDNSKLSPPHRQIQNTLGSSADWYAEVPSFCCSVLWNKVETMRLFNRCKLASGSLNTVITPD